MDLPVDKQIGLVSWWTQYRFKNNLLDYKVDENAKTLEMKYDPDLSKLVELYDLDRLNYFAYFGIRMIMYQCGHNNDIPVIMAKFPACSEVNEKPKEEFFKHIELEEANGDLKELVLLILFNIEAVKQFTPEKIVFNEPVYNILVTSIHKYVEMEKLAIDMSQAIGNGFTPTLNKMSGLEKIAKYAWDELFTIYKTLKNEKPEFFDRMEEKKKAPGMPEFDPLPFDLGLYYKWK